MPDEPKAQRKLDKQRTRAILRDARDIIWSARRRLLIGLPLMLINRLAGIVLPGTTKYLIDGVIVHRQEGLLLKIVTVAGIATAIGAVTDYALAQILSSTCSGFPLRISTTRRPGSWSHG
jgi:ABC-type bacteriocin/lantibiotic exporter with double-glycine peptidase domain